MSHGATTSHELAKIPFVAIPLLGDEIHFNAGRPQGAYAKLADPKDTSKERCSQKRTWSQLQDSLRPFRLQFISLIFGYLTNWKCNTEYRKVAMYRSRRVAALHSLLHLIPLCGAITILTLQWSNYWVGTETNDATLLQFAAKFHELTMQASLVEALLSIIRAEAVNRYVPLGALSVVMQPAQLSYLWSLDFISVFRSSALPGWRRAALILTVPVIMILTSLVGPSSAILMIPRPGTSHIERKDTLYARNPTDTFYPPMLTQSNGLRFDLQRYNTTTQRRVYDIQAENKTTATYQYVSRLMVNDLDTRIPDLDCGQRRSLQSFLERSPDNDISTVTLPTCMTAYGYSFLGMPFDMQNRTTSITTVHPVVSTRCTSPSQEAKYLEMDDNSRDSTGQNTKISFFHDNGTSLGILFDFHTLGSLLSNFSGPSNAIILNSTKGAYYPPIWVVSPEPGSNSLIGVFPYWRFPPWSSRLISNATIDSGSEMMREVRVKVCTTMAYWNLGQIQLIQEAGTSTAHAVTLPMIAPHNARYITLNITDILTMQDPKFVRDLLSIDTPTGGDIGSTLSEALAITISNVPDVYDVNVLRPELPPPEHYDERNMSRFNFATIVDGYGYGTTSISIRLAMAVMIAYCVVTVAYIAYILATGSTSTAWNSGIELVVLALQSRKPDHLGNAGVGIESLKTFQQGVGIRVNREDELELVFERDRDIDNNGLRRIARNKKY